MIISTCHSVNAKPLKLLYLPNWLNFCQIVKKQIKAEIIYENEKVLAFCDINPQAPVHFLIVPKQHIESIKSDGAESIASDLIRAAKEIAKSKEINGFKLLFCVGKEGGQTINHLHLHLLANKHLSKKALLNL